MPTRMKRRWQVDANNQFTRQIGWKTSRNGKSVQHKFRLGSDVKQAQQRETLLRQIWERIEQMQARGGLHELPVPRTFSYHGLVHPGPRQTRNLATTPC